LDILEILYSSAEIKCLLRSGFINIGINTSHFAWRPTGFCARLFRRRL